MGLAVIVRVESTGYPRCRSGRPRADTAADIREADRTSQHGRGSPIGEERDRWGEHWRMVDLEHEEEHLLDVLDRPRRLRGGPGALLRPRATAVLIGVTERRLLLVSHGPRDEVVVTERRHAAPRLMPIATAPIELDTTRDIRIDLTPAIGAAVDAGRQVEAVDRPASAERRGLSRAGCAGQRRDGAAVGLALARPS